MVEIQRDNNGFAVPCDYYLHRGFATTYCHHPSTHKEGPLNLCEEHKGWAVEPRGDTQ